MASKSMSRKKVWDALDAADATTALSNYATAEAAIAAAQADATTALADAATAQAAADALALKSDIVASKAANNAAAVKTNAQMPDTTVTCKVVDENGTTIGYLALYENADLSAGV